MMRATANYNMKGAGYTVSQERNGSQTNTDILHRTPLSDGLFLILAISNDVASRGP